MKIKRLTLVGFGPYKDEQSVDFERFDDDGIFLITGKTGAGKSSILDAICFALYGSVPRYEGTHQQLRSDHSGPDDPTRVDLEFTVAGLDYLVTRTPEYERPKKRGTGVAKQLHEASIAVRDPDGWRVIAARPVDVAYEIARVVALTKDQFLQVVLLAQNRFQEFLLAKNDERQAVLRTLFGSRRFADIEGALDERRKTAQAALDSSSAHFAALAAQAASLLDVDAPASATGVWFDAGLAQLADALAAASIRAADADTTFAAADGAVREATQTRELQRRRDAATATLSSLANDSGARANDAEELDAARRAAPVWPLVGILERAVAALDDARSVETRASAAWQPFAPLFATLSATQLAGAPGADLPGTSALDTSALGNIVESIGAQLSALAEALAQEARLPRLDASIAKLTARVAALEAELATALVLEAQQPLALARNAADAAHASATAARLADATALVDTLGVARGAAVAALDLESRLDLAHAAEAAASSAHTGASAALDLLLERRLNGHAAELASALVPGEPCAVCGSTTHPAPAPRATEPVTEAAVEAARALITTRRLAMDAAHTAVLDLSTRLAESRGLAAGRDVEQLDDAMATAVADRESAIGAAADVVTLERARLALTRAAEASSESIGRLRTDRDSARQSLAETTADRTGVLARAANQRGTAESVTARAAELEQQRRAARALSSAATAATSAQLAVDSAGASLDVHVVEQRFTSAANAVLAHRSDSQIAALEARIRESERAESTARATLDEPLVAAAPVASIDLEGASETRATALAERDGALARATTLSGTVTQLRAVVAATHDQLEATGQQRVQFDQLRELASVVRGDEPNTRRMRLETFVLAAQLEEIVAAANTRLRTMSSGRYSLEHNDALQYRKGQSGLGLSIRDEHTGRTRATHSLSGGETFLASLALALGLAEVVTNQTGGITLDTLFVDEGFGSLDGETLEIAMSTLDGLRAGGRTIGLISHVEAMKEQIPAKLRITASPRGDSTIEQQL